ncbi:MAG: ABC transporter ATP-binding protein [Gemmatimonadota bacterium]|nr:ABC transporter ATP-binding protein [Gemmatimonadota bacterium]MDH5804033.1 ABC transporter ATP-binding protein [Gemmatimonadota bacterium]
MIKVKGLSKRFRGHDVLANIDLDIARGERVAVLGLNGAGKTTLIRCLLGLTDCDGSIEVEGHDVLIDERAARKHLGYVPQKPPHFDGLTNEFIEMFSRLRGIDPRAVEQHLERLGLSPEEHGEKALKELSGGMMQKLLLALALGSEVGVLLLDEPTANLDPRARKEFLRALKEVDDNTTIIAATHRFTDVQALAERIIVLDRGKVAFDGTKSDLLGRVGAEAVLWISVPANLRSDAAERLAKRFERDAVTMNGQAVGIRIDSAQRSDAIGELRDAGIPIENMWTDAPALHEILEPIIGHGERREG